GAALWPADGRDRRSPDRSRAWRPPVRQWVLTLPHRLRYALAWNHELCRAVYTVFIRALLGFERRRATSRHIRGGRGGAVTAIQPFGSALNLNVHFHTLAVQGVFVDDATGSLRFMPNPEPSERSRVAKNWSPGTRIIRLREGDREYAFQFTRLPGCYRPYHAG